MNGNDTAFPVENRNQTPNESIQLGLTKRELFAAMAMQGFITAPGQSVKETIVAASVEMADLLLAALHPKDVAR